MDHASPVQGTTDAPAPRFYTAAEISHATERITGYNFNGGYNVPNAQAVTTVPQRLILQVIFTVMDTATPAYVGHLHLNEIRSLEAEVQARTVKREGAGREALEQVLAILQSTYANGGDNDEAGSITNTEHLLLDLEALHQRWAG